MKGARLSEKIGMSTPDRLFHRTVGKVRLQEGLKKSRCFCSWLGWSQDELAKAAKVGLSTIKDFENGKRNPISNNLEAMRAALEREGIGFAFAIEGGVAYASGITYSRAGDLNS